MTRGLAISWLIVGIVRLHPCLRETPIGFANSFGATAHLLAMHETIHTKRNRANRSLLNGKRSTPQRTAIKTNRDEPAGIHRGHAFEINLERSRSRERLSS